jgi:hypothetical protein
MIYNFKFNRTYHNIQMVRQQKLLVDEKLNRNIIIFKGMF